MAFSRFSRFRKRSFGRVSRGFRRFAPRMQTVHRPIKWERGNFHLTVVHSHQDPDRLLNTVVPIAQVQNLGDVLTSQGRALNQAARNVQVGGVKFTIAQWMVDSGPGEVATDHVGGLVGTVSTKVLLVSDALVTDSVAGTQAPQAIQSNFFTNTLPIASTAEVQDTEGLYPRRIHWQNFKSYNLWPGNIWTEGSEPPTNVPYAQQQVQMVNTHSGANLRLRLRLEDDEVLSFFCTSFLDVNSFAAEPDIAFRITGTIWYRFQF